MTDADSDEVMEVEQLNKSNENQTNGEESDERNTTASPKSNMATGKSEKPKSRKKLTEAEKALRIRTKEAKEKQRVEEKEKKEKERMELKMKKEKEKEDKKKQKEEERKQKEEEKKKKDEEKKKKDEEKRQKVEQLEEEKKRKELKMHEKKKKESEAEQKNLKEKLMMQNFFKKAKETPPSKGASSATKASSEHHISLFQPFEVKENMRLAPLLRLPWRVLREKMSALDCALLKEGTTSSDLYLHELKRGEVGGGKAPGTWLRLYDRDEEEDVVALSDDGDNDDDDGDDGDDRPEKKKLKMVRMKLLLFHQNNRPAYYGTWSKRSHRVTGRRPFGRDALLDYEVDSDAEWEEEEPGESISHSESDISEETTIQGDDDEEVEKDDDEEEEDGFFVPHGYLSEGEGCDDNDDMSPETLKARQMIKLRLFEEEMKAKKVKKLRSLCLGLYWGPDGLFEDAAIASGAVMEGIGLLEEEVVISDDEEDDGVTPKGGDGNDAKEREEGRAFERVVLREEQVERMRNFFADFQVRTFDKETTLPLSITPCEGNEGVGHPAKPPETSVTRVNKISPVPDEALPHLFRLVHGCQLGIDKISREFKLYWSQYKTGAGGGAKKRSDVGGSERKGGGGEGEGVAGANVPRSAPRESHDASVISKRQVEAKVRLVAEYKKVVERHPHRLWYVRDEVLQEHNLSHLPVPSAWVWKTAMPMKFRKSLLNEVDKCSPTELKTPKMSSVVPSSNCLNTTPKHHKHPSIMQFISQSGNAVKSLESARKQKLSITTLPSNLSPPQSDDHTLIEDGNKNNNTTATTNSNTATTNNNTTTNNTATTNNTTTNNTATTNNNNATNNDNNNKQSLKRPSDSDNEQEAKKFRADDNNNKRRRITPQQITNYSPVQNNITTSSNNLPNSTPIISDPLPSLVDCTHNQNAGDNLQNAVEAPPLNSLPTGLQQPITLNIPSSPSTPSNHAKPRRISLITSPNPPPTSPHFALPSDPTKSPSTPSNHSFKKPRRITVTTLQVAQPGSIEAVAVKGVAGVAVNGVDGVVDGDGVAVNGDKEKSGEVNDNANDDKDHQLNGGVNGLADGKGEEENDVFVVEVAENGSSLAQPLEVDSDFSNNSSSNIDNNHCHYYSSGSSSNEGVNNQTVINCYELLNNNTNKENDKEARIEYVGDVAKGCNGEKNEEDDVVMICDDSNDNDAKVLTSPAAGCRNKTITNFFKVLPSEKKHK